ncbi:MAG: T9SS type A sorting domain-containing protein [Bacteroidetes bacterium]|nr:T9SS type A sorting domain-containing protein [Bacteroidota bacterium]
MKKNITLLFLLFIFFVSAKAQIQNVIVEKYYVSDTLDATDSTNFFADPTYLTPILPVDSITYRVYVQLDSGYKIKKIYGTTCNPLKIISTANFFNNIDRPSEYFGYQIVKNYFSSNPTLALDSWLTLGLCAKNTTGSLRYRGVLKTDDPDGSFIGGTNNGGGTESIIGGIVQNNDVIAGIPIDTADGMEINTSTFSTPFWNGITDLSSVDTTVFGNVNIGSQFINTSGFLQETTGASGDSLLGNKVLVAQLTTTGTITFELNLELIDPSGASLNVVSHDCGIPVTGDTIISGLLKYPPDPPVCGCKDPNFLEYNQTAPCSDSSKCLTRIVFGCTDTLACNYDPHANYNIQYLCCYPGSCANRDISLVCPSIAGDGGFVVYPNPASTQISLQFSSGNNNQTKYAIFDSYGTSVLEKDLGERSGSIVEQIDVSDFHPGIYFVRLFIGTTMESTTFMKQ